MNIMALKSTSHGHTTIYSVFLELLEFHFFIWPEKISSFCLFMEGHMGSGETRVRKPTDSQHSVRCCASLLASVIKCREKQMKVLFKYCSDACTEV